MAGGTWTTQSKVRPGAYLNTKGIAKPGVSETARGVVALPLSLDFGPEGEVIEVTGSTDLTKLGYDLSSSKLLMLKEALKRAAKVLVFRISSGTKAQATEGQLTIEANYTGTRGNAIKVVSVANANIEGAFNVTTYLDATPIDTQTAKNVEDLKANELVTFSGTGVLTAATTALAGGTTTEATAGDYAKAFAAFEVYEFNTLAITSTDEAIKVAAVAFVKRLRDDEGYKCQVVVSEYAADTEAAINVLNGVILKDGTKLTAAQAVAWVAGATASANVAESLTYTAYDGAVDVAPRLTNSETIDALQTGGFVFTFKRNTAIVEQDINSLVSFTGGRTSVFRKNRVLRVLDEIDNNTRKSFEDNYIGKINNDENGRQLFYADRLVFFQNLQAQGAIQNFEKTDIEILPGNDIDSIVMNSGVQPVDAVEKLYGTTIVQ